MKYVLEYEIISKGKIILKNSIKDENISEEDLIKISNYWEEYVKSKHKSIFNDKVLRFLRIDPNNKKEVHVTFTDYKNIIVDRNFLNCSLGFYQVGISGLTIICENRKNFVLFAKRSQNVTEYPNFYELVPSGNLDKSVLKNDGTINFNLKILEEFREETGLSDSFIDNIEPFCFVRDNINHVYDVCCILKLNLERKQFINSFKNNLEFNSPCFIESKNLEKFLVENKSKIVPTSKAMIQCFLEEKK